jgi:hypothetical protein
MHANSPKGHGPHAGLLPARLRAGGGLLQGFWKESEAPEMGEPVAESVMLACPHSSNQQQSVSHPYQAASESTLRNRENCLRRVHVEGACTPVGC